MSRARHVLLAVLSVVAVYAVAAASASAHAIVIEGKEIANGEHIAAEGSTGASFLVVREEVTTECKKSTSVDEFEAGGKSKGTVTTKECRVIGEPGCKVAEPIISKTKTELVSFLGKLVLKTLPASGETFSTTTMTGCSRSELNGTWSLKGSQLSELPEAEVEKVEHEIVTKPWGSSLKVGEFKATLETKGTAKLASGKKWHSI